MHRRQSAACLPGCAGQSLKAGLARCLRGALWIVRHNLVPMRLTSGCSPELIFAGSTKCFPALNWTRGRVARLL